MAIHLIGTHGGWVYFLFELEKLENLRQARGAGAAGPNS